MIKSGKNLVYTSIFESLLEEYKENNSLSNEDIEKNSGVIHSILLYFYDVEIKPNISSYSDIESLNRLFRVYKGLCFKYNIKLSINVFLSWLNISKYVFRSLLNGDRNIYISDNGLFIYNLKEFNLLYPKDKYYIFSNENNSSIVSNICRQWLEDCEASTLDGVLNTRGNPAGLIFALKSIYGYSETKHTETETEKIGSRSADQIACDYSGVLENCADQKNNLPALP